MQNIIRQRTHLRRGTFFPRKFSIHLQPFEKTCSSPAFCCVVDANLSKFFIKVMTSSPMPSSHTMGLRCPTLHQPTLTPSSHPKAVVHTRRNIRAKRDANAAVVLSIPFECLGSHTVCSMYSVSVLSPSKRDNTQLVFPGFLGALGTSKIRPKSCRKSFFINIVDFRFVIFLWWCETVLGPRTVHFALCVAAAGCRLQNCDIMTKSTITAQK